MKKIFEEYKFKHGKVIQNRLVLAPMTTYSSNLDLTLSKAEERYYHSRAKGMGMVITAATAVNKNAQAFERQISARDVRYKDSLKRLATAIKSNGAAAILQLHHGGRMNMPGLYPNQDIVSASSVKANRDYAVVPRELKTSEVYDIIDDFTNACRLAIAAGFDGIELHGANTYLLQQFFSPHSNHRTDEFGGSREKRAKFIMTLVDRVLQVKRDENADDFVIGYRFSPEEIEEPGIRMEDTLYLVNELAKKDIDYLHVSLGNYKATSIHDKDNVLIATRILNVISRRIPLIGVGNLESRDQLEEALEIGYDLTSLGLIALADKNVSAKIKNNQTPSKVFTKNSGLPAPLYERIKTWGKGLESRGYTFE
ncbi:MAG: NADH-dependent flavin oxidoreductase [Bacilli bacterium]|nr:NADH-dependent flavin oxidoreductase [Bacilli bacterium]